MVCLVYIILQQQTLIRIRILAIVQTVKALKESNTFKGGLVIEVSTGINTLS